jgi:hypothetical protein
LWDILLYLLLFNFLRLVLFFSLIVHKDAVEGLLGLCFLCLFSLFRGLLLVFLLILFLNLFNFLLLNFTFFFLLTNNIYILNHGLLVDLRLNVLLNHLDYSRLPAALSSLLGRARRLPGRSLGGRLFTAGLSLFGRWFAARGLGYRGFDIFEFALGNDFPALFPEALLLLRHLQLVLLLILLLLLFLLIQLLGELALLPLHLVDLLLLRHVGVVVFFRLLTVLLFGLLLFLLGDFSGGSGGLFVFFHGLGFFWGRGFLLLTLIVTAFEFFFVLGALLTGYFFLRFLYNTFLLLLLLDLLLLLLPVLLFITIIITITILLHRLVFLFSSGFLLGRFFFLLFRRCLLI